MRISTEIRNRRMMGFLLKGKPPKEVARKFNVSVWAVYKAQKEMEKANRNGSAREHPALQSNRSL